jgi:hypothetical protein
MGGRLKPYIAIPALIALACCFAVFQILAAALILPQKTDTEKPRVNARTKTVVDLKERELLSMYPADLGRIEFAKDQDGLGNLLKQVGQRVDDLFLNFNNTSSKEQVVLRRMGSSGQPVAYLRSDFNYLILAHSNESGVGFEEERTDSVGKSVELPAGNNRLAKELATMSGFVVTSGFAAFCLYLHPSHQDGSRFRYLGRVRAAPHAQVIAFAQKPEVGDYLAAIGSSRGIIYVLLQGLIWLDPLTYQIVRMRTDLLEPDLPDGVTVQTTDIRLSDVHFADSPQVLWLPRQVEVSLVVQGVLYRNTHSYSDYKLFRVDTRIIK